MMRADIVNSIKGLLEATGVFSSVCGIGSEKPGYPLVRVWANGCPQTNIENSPRAMIDLRVAVQIETHPVLDSNGNSDEAGLYDLVDSAFKALHNMKLPGKGSLPLIVFDHPGLSTYEQSKPLVYLIQVSVRVVPEAFSTI